MTHETVVHTADAELVLGQQPVIDADVAADAIGEWLGFVSEPIKEPPEG